MAAPVVKLQMSLHLPPSTIMFSRAHVRLGGKVCSALPTLTSARPAHVVMVLPVPSREIPAAKCQPACTLVPVGQATRVAIVRLMWMNVLHHHARMEPCVMIVEAAQRRMRVP